MTEGRDGRIRARRFEHDRVRVGRSWGWKEKRVRYEIRTGQVGTEAGVLQQGRSVSVTGKGMEQVQVCEGQGRWGSQSDRRACIASV